MWPVWARAERETWIYCLDRRDTGHDHPDWDAGLKQQAALQWRHNGHDGVSNHQPQDCFSSVYSGADKRKHQSSESLAFVRGIHRWPVNSPHSNAENVSIWCRHHEEPGPRLNIKTVFPMYGISELIIGLRPANERWRYFVTTSLIGWAQT